MGLDHVPEMHCLHQKVWLIAEQSKAIDFEKFLFATWVNLS